ncbi:hypothetical protein U5A82_08560 [Sphingobium sp. CR2-8]|uniref:hypothetical protein n=1 Tax=Sphingobium sp. CR2-8 TaxID=1306534 RepID=UPI002DBD3096|nr:hypothetical protein [Sphingobium sp. CR2-8]MEC3910533.1 hypothetical protein [Sphingobium sp. CR2-8]
MSGRFGLVPMLLTLTLLVGCRGASADSAQTDNGAAPPVDVAATVEPQPAPLPLENTVAPVKASPVVTVRAQPAPLHALDLPPSDDDMSALPFPQEVTSFMVDRDGCDHFRGEQPYDAERRAYIAENIAELCQGTDARLAMLRRRYAGDRSVTAALKGYEAHIEGVTSY